MALSPSDARMKVSVKGPDGHAYMMYTELSFLSSLTPVPEASSQAPKEFVGISSVASETLSTDDIEYHGFMAVIQEETDLPVESQTNIDWKTHSIQTDFSALSVTQVPIPIETALFFIDSGATSGISPDKNDFINLKPITREVKGIGGSSIIARGIDDIKILTAQNTTLWLRNSLFIPNTTVRLISVSSLTSDSNATVHFDRQKCWITNHSTGDTMAEG